MTVGIDKTRKRELPAKVEDPGGGGDVLSDCLGWPEGDDPPVLDGGSFKVGAGAVAGIELAVDEGQVRALLLPALKRSQGKKSADHERQKRLSAHDQRS